MIFPSTLQTTTALLYDAVALFARALDDLDRTQSIFMPSLSCESKGSWPYGTALIDAMRRVRSLLQCRRDV